MYLCLRIDLDYVPWDTPDAAEFGHGEPAVLLRLLDLSRHTGQKYHFFASNRVLRAFPAVGDTVLGEGHDLDWLCKHPDSAERAEKALRLFENLGHRPLGFATREAWPEGLAPEWVQGWRFLSSPPGPVPAGITQFPVETKPLREATRSGQTARNWTDAIKLTMRDAATRDRGVTVAVRPQVLSKFDPKLSHVREILDLAKALELPLVTLRELLDR